MTTPITDTKPRMLPQPKSGEASGLKKANRDFETIMLRQVVKAMRKTIPESGLLSSKTGKQLYDHLMESALSNALSKRGGIGISDVIEGQQPGGNQKKSEVLFKVYSPDHDIDD